ncbi:hypothetical protein R1flu_027187 [Riccia fluitans]|uniref:AIG1-type G domain-containing protein n=1 Tax=Riccia fluitans TaxID=41844 RepID=A0ABD1XI40_9MARC
MTKRRNVIIFGKTGSGKSTIANMLVSESLKNPKFAMGGSMQGVTNKCKKAKGDLYKVTDTVGLGEETDTERKDAEQMIIDFLKQTKDSYHHIIFAKRAGRQDQMDTALWEIFLTIFKEDPKQTTEGNDVYRGMLVVITDCKQGWLDKQKAPMKQYYGAVNDRFIGVDFPPIDEEDDEMEEYLSRKRTDQLRNLKETLDKYYIENGKAAFTPRYCNMNDGELRVFCKQLLSKVAKLAVKLGKNVDEFIRGLFQMITPWSSSQIIPFMMSLEDGDDLQDLL